MANYIDIEEAVRKRLVAAFPEYLTDANCAITDIDKVIPVILQAETQDKAVGCLLDFQGGGEFLTGTSFNTTAWLWRIGGIFLFHALGDETQLTAITRDIISRLHNLFVSDPRLNGLVDSVKVSQIAEMEVAMVNDFPFAWLYFTIEARER